MATLENWYTRRKGNDKATNLLEAVLKNFILDRLDYHTNDHKVCETFYQNNIAGKYTGDLFKLDTKTKTPEQNIIEIIQGLYIKKQNEVSPTNKTVPVEIRAITMSRPQNSGSESRRLSYLNALVTLLCKQDRNTLGFTIEELMSW